MYKDLFTHIGELLRFRIQLTSSTGAPLDVDEYEVTFSASLDESSPTLKTIVLDDGIEIINEDLAIYEISFTTLEADGFKVGDHIYQLAITNNTTGDLSIILEGRLIIKTTLAELP